MSRSYSIVRRKTHLIDIVIPLIPGVDTYRLKWAANFDSSFTTIVDAPRSGYLGSSQAFVTIAGVDSNGGVTYRSQDASKTGNLIRVRHVVAGASTPLTIVVSGTDITVNVATSGGSAATSTATQIAAAIAASAPATLLVTATPTGTGASVTAAAGYTNLAGGFDSSRSAHVELPGEMCRVIFDPSSFSIPDGSPFWLNFTPVTAGASGTTTPPLLVLPPDYGNAPIIIRGTAPSGAGLVNSLELLMPKAMADLRVTNEDGANSLFLAFSSGGAEMAFAGATPPAAIVNSTQQANFTSLFVRGAGGGVVFSASFTPAFAK